MFDIDDSIPIPPHNQRNIKYPWEGMKVGDSFFVPAEEDIGRNRTRNAAYQANQRYGSNRYTTRKVTGGVRVWRVE